jgi:RimJ/RimL family protein N-acetyltransferase
MESDKLKMLEINSDPKVMEFFPGIVNSKQTEDFVDRMQRQFADKGFCYFAVDKLNDNQFIGFIGISEQTYESDFTPCVDIGWRLNQKEWNKGFATEGARRCLEFAFNDIELNNINAICPIINEKSQRVMEKIGMTKRQIFNHSLLKNNHSLEKCVLFEIEKSND